MHSPSKKPFQLFKKFFQSLTVCPLFSVLTSWPHTILHSLQEEAYHVQNDKEVYKEHNSVTDGPKG